MPLPKFLQVFLPSYDIKRMDLRDPYDKQLIIEAILNRGTMKDVKWLFKTYSKREIKNVVKNPSRGRWDERFLNYWLNIFAIKLHPVIHESAIMNLKPDLAKWKRWFDFAKKRASKETLKRWADFGIIKRGNFKTLS